MKDGNGFISKGELEIIMGGIELEESQWKQIINECDTNGDGKVWKKNYIKNQKILIFFA